MRRQAAWTTLLVGVVLCAGGCSAEKSSYEEVRANAIDALDEIASVVPDPKEIVPGPEQDPYRCDDPLTLSPGRGALYTGHWHVSVSEAVKIDEFVDSLPSRLSDKWQQRELGIDVSFANVDLVHTEVGVSVAVEEAEVDGRPALEMIAISRCGILTDDAKG